MKKIIITASLIFSIIPCAANADFLGAFDSLVEMFRVNTFSEKKYKTHRNNKNVYWNIIVDASRHYDVDPYIIHCVIKHESYFDKNAVSHKGAIGLMQLMPGTAKSLGVVDPFDPVQNIYGGTLYLRKMLYMFDNDLRYALMAYNAGPGRVKINTIPKVSYAYAERIIRDYNAMRR